MPSKKHKNPKSGYRFVAKEIDGILTCMDDLEDLIVILLATINPEAPEMMIDVVVWDSHSEDVAAVVTGAGRVVRFHLDTAVLGRLIPHG
jgi:hypothetical protein